MTLDWMNFDYTSKGGQGHNDGGGFGQADLDEMKRLGYSDNQIKILANLAPHRTQEQGGPVTVYKPVQQYAESVAKPPWQYGAHGDAAFGKADIDAALSQGGVNYNKIKEYADFATETGIGVHQGAKDWIANNDPTVLGANKKPGSDWMHFDYDAVGGPGMGVKDIDEMQAQGYSPNQIRILANTAPTNKNIEVFQGAQDWVVKNTEKPPWMYGAHGQEHFGKADIDAALSQGDDYNTIKGYADFARETGIGVGPEAENWMQTEKLGIDTKATMQKAAEAAEYGRLASMRGGGSNTLSASGAATFKGKGLTTSENRRGKGRGTAQLRRPYGRSSLSIASMAKGNNPSTLNL